MHEINFFHEHELHDHDFLGCCKDCRNSLAIIKPHILGFADNIKHYTHEMLAKLPMEELYRLYQILDDLAHMDAGGHLAGLLLNEPEIRDQLPLIRSYYTDFFSIHEAGLARELIRQEDPWEHLKRFPLYPRYEMLVKNQIKAMDIPKSKRLVFLGCGPVPMSLILMSHLYGIHSVGLDSQPETVDLSRQVIQHLGLEKDIEIIKGNDTSLADMDWDVILVAALAEPKERIFQHIHALLKERPEVPVIFRTYTGMKAVLYKPVQQDEIRGFKIEKAVAPTGRVNNTTVIMHVDQTQ